MEFEVEIPEETGGGRKVKNPNKAYYGGSFDITKPTEKAVAEAIRRMETVGWKPKRVLKQVILILDKYFKVEDGKVVAKDHKKSK